jgi:hypothetical protein
MKTILLRPTDVLFFRDGRPMDGSLAGHGAAWPLPTVVSAAFHAALHQADLEQATGQKIHHHLRGRNGIYDTNRQPDRKFGSLKTAGPFPVYKDGDTENWHFSRPADAQLAGSTKPTLLPRQVDRSTTPSSLAPELNYPVTNTGKATKDKLEAWWSEGAWNAYLGTLPRNRLAAQCSFKNDSDFADTEHFIGIGIDPNTGVQDGERLYSASYLRLREGWGLGTLATAPEQDFNDSAGDHDLICSLLKGDGGRIVIGGQQRACSAKFVGKTGSRLPLPLGKADDFTVADGRYLVKWILLSPAIWPEILENQQKGVKLHSGGWLPNWIEPGSGRVLLKADDTERGERENRNAWRVRVGKLLPFSARLVAAIVPKPLIVTGWALPNGTDRPDGGAKSTHLAVPAGAVYYFEATTAAEAQKLANALNWHGTTHGLEIKNRRSTLLGEKGFGLGVCGTWHFFSGGGMKNQRI